MQPSTPTTSAPLDYAAPTSPWRRRLRRALILSSITIALIVLSLSAPGIWQRMQIIYWQRQCCDYTASPDMVVYEVVYEELEYAAQQLEARDSRYFGHIASATSFSPSCWTNLQSLVRITPAPSGTAGNHAVVFLHKMRSPDGRDYLVHLEYGRVTQSKPSWAPGDDCGAHIVALATLLTPPTFHTWPATFNRIGWYVTSVPPNTRIYAGQPDPADPSHFTIRYENWGQTDILDGYLNANRTLTLQPRHPPTEPPPNSIPRRITSPPARHFTTQPAK